MLTLSEYHELVLLLKNEEINSHRVHVLKMEASDGQLIRSHEEAGVEQGLTDRDTDIQDETDGLIHQLLEDLTGNELDWDVSLVGDLRDSIVERLAKETGRTEYSFHPYMVSDDEGPPATFQSINDILKHQLRNAPFALEEFESLLDVVRELGEQADDDSEDFETEQDEINHLIDIVDDTISNWQILRRACGARS